MRRIVPYIMAFSFATVSYFPLTLSYWSSLFLLDIYHFCFSEECEDDVYL